MFVPNVPQTQSCRLVFAFADQALALEMLQAILRDRPNSRPRLPPPVQNPRALRKPHALCLQKSRPSDEQPIRAPSLQPAGCPSPGPHRETRDDSVSRSFQNSTCQSKPLTRARVGPTAGSFPANNSTTARVLPGFLS